MSDDDEETLIGAIDSSAYDDDDSGAEARRQQRHANRRKASKDADRPSPETLILNPQAPVSDKIEIPGNRHDNAQDKPQNKAQAKKQNKSQTKNHANTKRKSSAPLYAAVTLAAVVVAGVTIFLLSGSDKSQTDDKATDLGAVQEPASGTYAKAVSAADIFAAVTKDIESQDTESAKNSVNTLRVLAIDSAFTPAMLDYAILLVKPTRAFPELSEKQKRLSITPDLDTSTHLLSKILADHPANYKAAYWIYNNLMTKFENNAITADETRLLVSSFSSFKSAVSNASGDEAARYKKAMLEAGDEDTLKAWALI